MVSPLIKFLQKDVCVQTAVYWGNPQPDGYGGISYDPPVEIKCRWDEKVQLVRDDRGKEVVSKAEVLVLQDVDPDGMLYLGSLTDLSSGVLDSPEQVDGAWKILSMSKAPLFGSTSEFVRTAYL